ncbi:MAG: DUF5343 domain-containing protein [Candidatus Binatia bacterium]
MAKEKESTKTYNPPYIAANLWIEFFKRMQIVKRPSELNADELKEYGIAKGQEAALISGLKFLGLLDSTGKTKEEFKTIQITGEQFKENLGGLLTAAYGDLLTKHPLDHATYEGIKNYFAEKYSVASATKMAKSFATLCQQAGWGSPAFSKMRSLPKKENKESKAHESSAEEKQSEKAKTKTSRTSKSANERDDDNDLLKEFIKNNPLPTTGQWNSETLKTYFEQYRETIKMLKDKELKKE